MPRKCGVSLGRDLAIQERPPKGQDAPFGRVRKPFWSSDSGSGFGSGIQALGLGRDLAIKEGFPKKGAGRGRECRESVG